MFLLFFNEWTMDEKEKIKYRMKNKEDNEHEGFVEI